MRCAGPCRGVRSRPGRTWPTPWSADGWRCESSAEPTLIEDARSIASSVVADRRAIHRCPELAYQERQTAALVETRLRQLGIPLRAGVGGTVNEAEPVLAAEDFSFVLQRVPGAMLSLGVRAPDWAEPRPVHTARFDLDESALPVGVACLASIATEFLAS